MLRETKEHGEGTMAAFSNLQNKVDGTNIQIRGALAPGAPHQVTYIAIVIVIVIVIVMLILRCNTTL